MLKDIKNTLSQSAVYGLSRVATKLVSFILIPLYTSVFSSEVIANINLLESFWQYLFTVCMFAFETAIVNFCTSNKDMTARKRILFNFFSMLVFNSLVFIIAGFIFPEQISSYILKESGYGNVIFYCFLISAFESLLIMPMTISRLNSKPILYTVITVSSLLINLILQLVFILKFNLGFEYIFMAKFIAPAAVFIITLPYVIKYLEINFDFKEIKTLLKFSFPLMLAMLTSLLLNSVDRFILSDYVSKLDVAVYTTGYSIGSVTNAFILTPFNLAIQIIFWKKINDDNFRRFMTKSSTYLFFSMIFISLVLSFIIPYAVKLFVRNEALWPSMEIIPFILFSNCFVALFIFPSLDLYYKRTTGIILFIIFICLAFKVITNILFIKSFGIFASAVITVISYILMIILGYIYTKKFSFTKFEIKKIAMLSVLFMIFVYASFLLNPAGMLTDLALKTLMIFIFLFLLYILHFFEPIEIERIKGFFNKYFIKRIR